MTFGVEIYGTHGRLQLGENVGNYYMVEKGSITDSTWGDFGFNRGTPSPWWNAGEGAMSKTHTLPTTLPYDFVALGGTNIELVVPSSGAYGVGVPSGPSGPVATSGPPSGSRTLYWYTFRSYKHLSPATTGYGMEIINPATGLVNFSLRYPKILKTLMKVDYNEGTTALPSGKTLALIGFGTCYRENQYVDNPETGVMSFYNNLNCKIDGSNNLTMSRNSDWSGLSASSGASIDRTDGGVIVLDVTNY